MNKVFRQIPFGIQLLLAILVNQAQAHFVWVYPENQSVKLVLGEGPSPEKAEYLKQLKELRAFTFLDGKWQSVQLIKKTENDLGWLEIAKDKLGSNLEVSTTYGVFVRGDNRMLLDYNAKFISLDNLPSSSEPSTHLNLDIQVRPKGNKLELTVYFEDQPTASIQIHVTDRMGAVTELLTDAAGQATISASQSHLIRAKLVVNKAGEYSEERFDEHRYYCTVVVDAGDEEPLSESKSSEVFLRKLTATYPDLPRGLTSFGAAVVDKQIVLIGGKSGKAHSYAKSYQNQDVLSLNLNGKDSEWSVIGENLGLQGLAVVADGQSVYRIGGLEACNSEGEEHDLRSSADFLRFTPSTGDWKSMPSLPERRSSMDACVVGDSVFVVGGWTMDGENQPVWAEGMVTYCLTDPNGNWESIETPFRARALAVAADSQRLIVVGGIQAEGGASSSVYFYDLKDKVWSTGPSIPCDDEMKAFGCAAANVAGQILVSTYDGSIFRLLPDAKSWQKIHQLEEGRFFHRMLPVGDSKFALIGGAHMDHGNQLGVEVYELCETVTVNSSK